MNKKGFTLIELLAVIVILAIIALIATPAVLNIIEDSKESAAKDSASVIAKAAETYYVSNVTLQGEEVGTIDLTDETLQYKGEKPEKGSVTFDEKGNSYLKMYMNGYCIISDYDNTVVSEKMDSEDCEISSGSAVEVKLFEDGDEVYFNPITNSVCDTYVVSNSNVEFLGTESNGCMKWYAFLDTEEATSVKLLLDHNTTRDKAWNTAGLTTPDTVLAELSVDIDGWHENVRSTARLLKATEVDEIVDEYAKTAQNYGTANQIWDVNNLFTYYYFTTGDPYTGYDGEANGQHELGWLCANTSSMASGCAFEDGLGSPYWTSDTPGINPNTDKAVAWLVGQGTIGSGEVTDDVFVGVRPVIEVPRTVLAN